jgi:integrase
VTVSADLPRGIEKCKKADDTFPAITPHDLRHTAASPATVRRSDVPALAELRSLLDGPARRVTRFSDLASAGRYSR